MVGVSASSLSIVSIADSTTLNMITNNLFNNKLLSLRGNLRIKSNDQSVVEYTTTAVLQSFGDEYSDVNDMISDLNNQVIILFFHLYIYLHPYDIIGCNCIR